MERSSSRVANRGSRFINITWVLAIVVAFFAVENILVDPWLKSRWHRFPSLVPEPLSPAWFVDFIMMGILCSLLVVCQILVILDRSLPRLKKWGIACATLCVLLLCTWWFFFTVGQSFPFSVQYKGRKQAVTLNWNPSISVVDGYNVYRRALLGGPYVKINKDHVKGLTYVDREVESGVKYYYVVRAVGKDGVESWDSNEASAAVP
ncbi:MAG: fibronectin type III domain-containing protein [Candidatus Acidiferrum sp.]